MPNIPDETTPYWNTSASLPRFGPLGEDVTVDVLIVGGGITGLTTAYLLAKAGRSVAVLERGRCAMADTGHTSAHLTMVTDARPGELEHRIGASHAQATWDAGLAAIAHVEDFLQSRELDADFARIPGYLHAPTGGADDACVRGLTRDAEAARQWGFDVELLDEVPVIATSGIRFDAQARIHPRKYLAGVARALVEAGGRIFEHTDVAEFADDPRRVTANGHTVRCADVVIATHNPLVGLDSAAAASLRQTKLALYTSYVVAGRLPSDTVEDALWWDTADPYQYLRLERHRGFDVAILGGEDHKTGQEPDTRIRYERLEKRFAELFPGQRTAHAWSGQVIETPDGLPYIGESSPHQYIATGFAGNGLTFGTVAALIISDAILGVANPWAALFALDRPVVRRGFWDYVKENADYPYYMLRDRFAGVESRSLRAVKRGTGRVIEHKGQKVAAYRDPSGSVTMCSAICTHLGCTVAWNTAEGTWDCPCHGSRFKTDGAIIAGPAEAPLPKVAP